MTNIRKKWILIFLIKGILLVSLSSANDLFINYRDKEFSQDFKLGVSFIPLYNSSQIKSNKNKSGYEFGLEVDYGIFTPKRRIEIALHTSVYPIPKNYKVTDNEAFVDIDFNNKIYHRQEILYNERVIPAFDIKGSIAGFAKMVRIYGTAGLHFVYVRQYKEIKNEFMLWGQNIPDRKEHSYSQTISDVFLKYDIVFGFGSALCTSIGEFGTECLYEESGFYYVKLFWKTCIRKRKKQ